MSIDNFRFWARSQFAAYKGCIAFVESQAPDGEIGCGTCFHVGEGVFVTARHVIENRTITQIGFDDDAVNQELLQDRKFWGQQQQGRLTVVEGPFFHSKQNVDVACFRVEPHPKAWLPLGGHLDDFLGQHELLLYRTLVIGYPPIPLTSEPKLVASVGEVNALVDLYVGSHPHFIISTMARGGFSGAPVLVAYNEDNTSSGTAVLGIVTQSLVENNKSTEHGYMAVLTVEPIFTCLEQHNMLPKGQGYE
jgi:hypothetical protein